MLAVAIFMFSCMLIMIWSKSVWQTYSLLVILIVGMCTGVYIGSL